MHEACIFGQVAGRSTREVGGLEQSFLSTKIETFSSRHESSVSTQDIPLKDPPGKTFYERILGLAESREAAPTALGGGDPVRWNIPDYVSVRLAGAG